MITKKLSALLAAFAAFFIACAPVQAQWQVPDHSVPVGRGAGVQGFKSVGPCAAGQPVVGAGVSSDPACGSIDGSNYISGVVGSTHGGAGSVNGVLKADGSGVVTAATSTDLPNPNAFVPTYLSTPLTSDAVYNDSVTITSTIGNPTITVTGQSFTSGDIGKLITVGKLGGGGGNPLSTSIIGVSGSNITLANNAGVSLAGVSSYLVFGTDNAATLQALADSVPAGGGTLSISAGNYLVSAVTELSSHTRVKCSPGVTLYMLDGWSAISQHWIFSNKNNTAPPTLADEDIHVDGCGFNGATPTPSTGAHAVMFFSATNVSVTNSVCNNFSDCTAFLNTNISLVQNNRAYNIINTCYDTWWGASHVKIIDNYCETSTHGIQVTGTDSPQTGALITSDVLISGNTIVTSELNTSASAIWLNSGASSDNGAGVANAVIIGNTVKGVNLGAGEIASCFKASGSGTTNVRVSSMVCENAFVYAAPTDALSTSYPTNITFDNIVIKSTDSTVPHVAAQIRCEGCGIQNSQIVGGGYTYAIDLKLKTKQFALNNQITNGATGRYDIDATSSADLKIVDPTALSIHSAVSQTPVTGTTSETVSATVTIPHYLVGPNGYIVARAVWNTTNNANNKDFRVRFGGLSGTAFGFQRVTTAASASTETVIRNRNNVAQNVSFVSGYGTSTSAAITGTINTANDQTLVFTAQNANSGDTSTLEAYEVLIIRP